MLKRIYEKKQKLSNYLKTHSLIISLNDYILAKSKST